MVSNRGEMNSIKSKIWLKLQDKAALYVVRQRSRASL